MKEELTTLMHTEFLSDKEEILDILTMSAYIRIQKGQDKTTVLKELNLSEADYENRYNIIIKPYISRK